MDPHNRVLLNKNRYSSCQRGHATKWPAVILDLIVSHRFVGTWGTLPRSVLLVSCQQTAIAVTPSWLKRFFTWISSITLMFQRQPKKNIPTVCSSYHVKITVTAFDINTFPPVAGCSCLSFVCLFSFWNSRLCCAKVAFVCDDPAEQLSWVWSAEIQEVGLLFNLCFVINGDT